MKKHFLFILAVCTLLSACKIDIDSSKNNQDNTPEEKNFLVNYQTDYGVIPDSLKDGITVKENTVLTAEQLPVLTADEVVFKGWYDGKTKVVAGEYKVTKNVTLTASWGTEATVSYSSIFGTALQSFKTESNSTLTEAQLAAIECSPYTFLGWFYEKEEDGNGSGTQAKAGDAIKSDITKISESNAYSKTRFCRSRGS